MKGFDGLKNLKDLQLIYNKNWACQSPAPAHFSVFNMEHGNNKLIKIVNVICKLKKKK
jgi:hypothetical protein